MVPSKQIFISPSCLFFVFKFIENKNKIKKNSGQRANTVHLIHFNDQNEWKQRVRIENKEKIMTKMKCKA